jgi:hypothetical protein
LLNEQFLLPSFFALAKREGWFVDAVSLVGPPTPSLRATPPIAAQQEGRLFAGMPHTNSLSHAGRGLG